jgi:serine/threonine protein kinase/formylglycine-generating enzyme required for sulfatase activity
MRVIQTSRTEQLSLWILKLTNWNPRANEIFAEAVELAASERETFVRSRCAGDTSLQDRVHQLIRLHDTAGSFLLAPAFAAKLGRISIPGYTIEGIVGRGAMGIVYKAQHLALKRTVALKLMQAACYAGPRERVRFHIESEASARLHHPNIVQIYEIGEADGYPYCALEYVDGSSLASKLDSHSIKASDAARLVELLARAMQVAHSRNIVHRDLKPANVLLTLDGTPKIADFGLARRLDVDSGETEAGSVIGTPSYMAPEQASGQAHQAGPASDLYAIGAILYHCLAGRPPFVGKSFVDTLDQVRSHEAAPPSKWIKSVPLDLDTICLKCLRKEPENRYTSAAELADDLARFLRSEPILARPVGRVERTFKLIRRNPITAGFVFALVLALALGTTVSYLKYLDAEQQRRFAKYEATKAERASDYIASMFELADANGQRSTMSARQILTDAERDIQLQFSDQPELRDKLLTQIGNVYDKLDATSPLAMILEVSGDVSLQSSRNTKNLPVPQALLYSGDRLGLSQDAQVLLLFIFDHHKEWLASGKEATILRKGCAPADAVRSREDGIVLSFVRLPKGTFYMGGGGGVAGVPVEIENDFEISIHLVTQGQWQSVMGNNPSSFSRFGADYDRAQSIPDGELSLLPVECVSEDDVQKFLIRLNERTRTSGWSYRLPTSEEWEYACRAGATSKEECSYHFYFSQPTNSISSAEANFNGQFHYGDEFKDNCLERPSRIGMYPPNKIGLYDMHGNLSQWCSNSDGNQRIYRGGAWGSDGFHCRAAERNIIDQWNRSRATGFRLVRTSTNMASVER